MVHLDLPIVLQKMEVIDLPNVSKLELKSYPDEEAASRKLLDYRINYASHLCYIAYHKDKQQMVGFVVSTGAPDDTQHITDDNMRNHYQGNVACIHSVVIDPEFRRKGYGTFMLKSYIEKIKMNTDINKMLLLSKKYLLPFYQSAGFAPIGVSGISHGKDQWTEMELTFDR